MTNILRKSVYERTTDEKWEPPISYRLEVTNACGAGQSHESRPLSRIAPAKLGRTQAAIKEKTTHSHQQQQKKRRNECIIASLDNVLMKIYSPSHTTITTAQYLYDVGFRFFFVVVSILFLVPRHCHCSQIGLFSFFFALSVLFCFVSCVDRWSAAYGPTINTHETI